MNNILVITHPRLLVIYNYVNKIYYLELDVLKGIY